MHREIDFRIRKNTAIIARIAAYLAIAVMLLSISWDAWPDITVDFGRELYMPWQVINGGNVYGGIDYYYGAPVSVYWNAFWFLVFGVSLHTLVFVNIALLAVLVIFIEYWLRELGDEFLSTSGVLFFLMVFAFNRYVGIGNYNYITPYSHALVQGIILIFAMLLSIRWWEKTGKTFWLGIAGLSFGLSVIGKFEIAIAAIFTAITYFAAILYMRSTDLLKKKNLIFFFFIFPPILMIFVLAKSIPLGLALHGVFGQWEMFFNGSLSQANNTLFFQSSMGINGIVENSIRLLDWSWTYFGIVLVGLFFTFVFKARKRWVLLTSTMIIIVAWSSTYFLVPVGVWLGAARPLPLIMLSGFIILLLQIVKYGKKLNRDSNLAFSLASFAFGGALLFKILLNARLYHYGFVLAMPATLLTIYTVFYWIPRLIAQHGYPTWPFKAFTVGFIFTLALIYIQISGNVYSRNNYPITFNGDTIFTNQTKGQVLEEVLNELDRRLTHNQTVAVMPDGVMLNYLLRRRNPTPFISLMPDLFVRYDEQDVINQFSKNSPDLLVLLHTDTSEYGFKFFGKDYAKNMYNWIAKNYDVVWHSEQKPFEQGTIFGATIAEHKHTK